MIDHVSGVLIEKEFTRAVVSTGGIGFDLLIPMSTYDRLPRKGEEITLKTILHVREDAMQLFGFFSDAERDLYHLVTDVTGIGPKLGLSVLSCMSVNSFCAAIVNADIKALSKIQGIGKRSAERLVVELKDKIEQIAPSIAISGKAPEEPLSRAAEDAVGGLVTLGYKADAARKAIRKLIEAAPDQEHSAQDLIKQALGKISK